MGYALEVITGRALNPGATPVALTANSGDTFVVRSTPFENPPALEGIWALGATAGIVRVRSPRLHDNVQGIRFRTIAATTRNFVADELAQRLYPQDALTFELSGGGAETDSASLLIGYPDLPGISAQLFTWDAIKPRIQNILTAEVAVAGPATAWDWSAGTTLNATFDLIKANVPYAIIGYQSDTAVNAVAVRGPDVGNLRVGGPGTSESLETRDWFVSLSENTGKPYIPVINGANKGNTQVFVAHNTAAGTINVDLVLAELSP
jgi:hypothetical protein